MSYENIFELEDDEFFEDDDLEDFDFEDDENDDEDWESDDEDGDDNEFFGERRRRGRRRSRRRRSPRSNVPKRSSLPVRRVRSNSSGVQQATLKTPRGDASLKLPEKVTPHKEFQAAVKRLSDGIAANTKRINTLQGDIAKVGTSVNKLSRATDSKIARVSREHSKSLAKLRKEQSAQRQSNMMLTLLTQQQVQSALSGHTHSVVQDATGALSAQPSSNVSSDNSMSMLLPLMMMSGDSGGGLFGGGKDGGGSNMMMLLLMMGGLFK